MEKILGLKLKLLSEKNQDLMFDYFQKNKDEEESDEDPKNKSHSQRSKSRAKNTVHQRNLLEKKQNDHLTMQTEQLTKKLFGEQVQRKKKLRQELV